MTTSYTFVITPAQVGERLDKAICTYVADLSRTRAQMLLELGHVTLVGPTGNQPIADAAFKVKPGQIFTVSVPEVEPSRIEAQAIELDVLYEDAHLLVINKPAGMTVHPAPGSPDQTLVNALLAHCGDTLSGIGGVSRPGIVHRLDKDTSGVMVVAKHDTAHRALSEQLLTRDLKRIYRALVWGILKTPRGTVTGNIGRHPVHRQKMAVVKTGGKTATTHYEVLEEFRETTLTVSFIECRLETGRTHQIRVHMQHMGHPLVGDSTYGKKLQGKKDALAAYNLQLATFPRQALHAFRLGFIHPISKEPMQFEAPLPDDIAALLTTLRTHHE